MFTRIWEDHRASLIAVIVLIVALLSTIIVVPETQQAVIVRLGEPERVINKFHPREDFGDTGAGIDLRIPFIERVVRIDKRIQTIDMEPQEVLSIDQLKLKVDAFARFRVIDPVRMVRSTGTVDQLKLQLEPIMTSVLRRELGNRTFQSLLTAERGVAMKNIREGFDREARAYGVQVIDVRIKQADLPQGALESTYQRMQAQRDQEATTIRAEGQKSAQIIRAEAEAKASQIYAEAFNKDPAFYDFYRAMKSYETTFADPDNKAASTIILSPDNDYLRQFKGR